MIDSYSILVQVVHSKSGTAGVFNWGGWKPEGVDALIDKAGQTIDRTERLAYQANALQILHDDITFLPLHQQPMAWATGKNGRLRAAALRQQGAALAHHDAADVGRAGPVARPIFSDWSTGRCSC